MDLVCVWVSTPMSSPGLKIKLKGESVLEMPFSPGFGLSVLGTTPKCVLWLG